MPRFFASLSWPPRFAVVLLVLLVGAAACDSNDDGTADDDGVPPGELAAAYAEFDVDNVTVLLDGDQVVVESNGYPNHTSPYWSPTHPLHLETDDRLTPGFIDEFNGSYALTVPSNPQRAATATATSLGPIGIAVSGAMIYNDREGPNEPIDRAIGSLDYTGAHTGPQSYHYHLEPVAWSEDDDKLIGIIADGFFLYGRRDLDGTYPSDLDASGGHTGPTPHNADGEYHYHIQNEAYLNAYYLLFPGEYQGTPSAIR